MREAALQVIRTLHEARQVALFAGGCVRDMCLGRQPKDYDVATDATPERIIALFRRTRKVGMKFGVVLVGAGRHWIEVATFRTDGPYSDGRRPVEVHFTDARQDALRRDFTINGMFYDPARDEVIDHVGGRADLEAGLIRAIGDPDRRFGEDHLRLLRAVRFAARFAFDIEADTASAIRRRAGDLRRISAERIRMELEMILSHEGRASAFRMLRDLGLLPNLWPDAAELEPHGQAIEATLERLTEACSFEAGFAAMLHPLPVDRVKAVCRALTCSNRSAQTVAWLLDHSEDVDQSDELSLADLKLLMANAGFGELVALWRARLAARGLSQEGLGRLERRAEDIRPEEIAPPPLLTGHDLAELGVPEGPKYKRILDAVYYQQLNGDIRDAESGRALAARLARES